MTEARANNEPIEEQPTGTDHWRLTFPVESS